MASSSKRSREPSADGVDRLSTMHTDILHNILSKLDFMDVVKTFVLSKRWRYVWMSVPCLNFSTDRFMKHNHEMSSYYDFWNFMKMVLLLRHETHIRRISVSASNDHSPKRAYRAYKLNELLCIADKLKVEELCFNGGASEIEELFFHDDYGPAHELVFPRVVCETLTMLSVNFRCKTPLRIAQVFSNLKTLYLRRVVISHDVAHKLLSSGCVKLENMHLQDCQISSDIEGISISACNLKNLVIVYVNHGGKFVVGRSFDSKLKICAPNLVYFCYTGPMPLGFALLNTVSLRHVSICILDLIKPRHNHEDELVNKPYPSRFIGLNHAKTLTFSDLVVKYFSPKHFDHLEDTFILMFHSPELKLKRVILDNVYRLELGLRYDLNCIEGLINLLHLSPNLEALVIRLNEDKSHSWSQGMTTFGVSTADQFQGSWKSRAEDIACLSYHVKFIQIYNFDGSEAAVEFIKFILKNAKVLGKMEIMHKSCDQRILKSLKRVKTLPKTSWRAVISFTTELENYMQEYQYA